MKTRCLLVVTLVVAVALSGCEYSRRYVSKPWGKGTFIPAAVCGAVGAGVGIAIQNERRGTSRVDVHNPDGTMTTVMKEDEKDLWEGAAVGAPAGALLCALIGHALFDREATPTPARAPMPSPTPEALPPPSSKRIVLRGVHFDFNKSDIRSDSRPVLDEATETLKENQSVRISVEGHTDAVGSVEYNQKLSVRRAEAVFRYLVNHGIAPERMEVVGYGKSRSVADNQTDAGRAQNRRVELHVAN
jgi:OOP family OmpA-OmpF porin